MGFGYPPTKFQLLSDLHFEGNRYENEYVTYLRKFKTTAPYLILAGDIGVASSPENELKYTEFLKQCCRRYHYVFLIAGNSEYQTNNTVPKMDAMMTRWAQDPEMGADLDDEFLNSWEPDKNMLGKLYVLIPGQSVFLAKHNVLVLGCTLWSEIKYGHGLADGKRLGGGTNSVTAHNARHRSHLGWLTREVQRVRTTQAYESDPKLLIITHHAPTASQSNQPGRDGQGPSWTNFQTDILGPGGAGFPHLRDGDVWVYGHTHYSNDFMVNPVRIVSNQRGGQRNDHKIAQTRYHPDFAFEM